MLKDLQRIKVDLELDGSITEKCFLEIYKLIWTNVHTDFKERRIELTEKRQQAYKASNWGQYEQLFKQLDKEKRELSVKYT